MSTLDEMQRRHREAARRRRVIVDQLDGRTPPRGSLNGGADSDLLAVALPRELVARLERLAQRIGAKRGVRALAAVLVRQALDDAEPLFPGGGSVTAQTNKKGQLAR